MRIGDKILAYIEQERKAGRLKPGDRLPSFKALCEQFNTSYATVFNAIAAFEKNGLVRRKQGDGVFMRGTERMRIVFSGIDPNVMSPDFLDFLRAECDKRNFYMDLEYSPARFEGDSLPGDCAAVLTTAALPRGAQLDFTQFEEYPEILRDLAPYCRRRGTEIPFYLYSHQFFVNPEITRKIAVSDSVSGENFDWLTNAGRDAVSGKSFYRDYWIFDESAALCRYMYLFLGLLFEDGKTLDNVFRPPFFNTNAGHKFVRLLRDMERDSEILGNFTSSIGNFYTGSWFAAQYKNKFHLRDEEIRIEPFRCKGRVINYVKQSMLSAYVREGMSFEEKKRVWGLIRLLSSREVQKRLTDFSGALSVRSDITDYAWNTHPDFQYFLPRGENIVINGNILETEKMMLFSTLIEQAAFFHADADSVLSLCDIKLGYFPDFDVKITDLKKYKSGKNKEQPHGMKQTPSNAGEMSPKNNGNNIIQNNNKSGGQIL